MRDRVSYIFGPLQAAMTLLDSQVIVKCYSLVGVGGSIGLASLDVELGGSYCKCQRR